MIKSWGFEFFPASHELAENFDAKKSLDYFSFYLDLWARAEEQGFDGVFLSEHHFGGGYSPSPNLLLPVIAQRTKTLRLGVMGNVLPYHNPWRIAEEIGMLDHLTGGRLEVGTSAGIPAEFQKVGMETGEARARYEEAVEVLDKALKNPVISHTGKYWNFEELAVVPRPVQDPHPQLWTTVMSEESARKAARRGSRIATGFIPTAKAKEVFDAYNEEADKAGNPSGPQELALRRQVIIDVEEGDSQERGSQFAEGFRNMLQTFDKRVIAPGRKALDQPGTHGFQLGDDEFIMGSPQEVAEQIIDQCKTSGAGHFLVTFAGHQSLEQLASSWEIYGREVIPALHDA